MWLTSAYKANYIRALTMKQVEDLIEIGNELDIRFKYNHCPKCLLDFVKKIAAKYFEHQDKAAKKAEAKQLNAEPVEKQEGEVNNG